MERAEGRKSRGPEATSRRNSVQSPTKASLAKHSPHLLKRDHGSLGLEYSPPKRHKSRTVTMHSTQTTNSLNTGHTFGYIGSPKKKPYLTESGKLNNQRGSTKRQNFFGKDHRTEPALEKLSFLSAVSNGYADQGSFRSIGGTRLSRTPPPLNNDYADDPSDPPLPPTPEPARELSPRARRRERESIFSSGNRKSRRKSGTSTHEYPGKSPSPRKKTVGSKVIAAEYYPAATNQVKNARPRAYLEHRISIQKEIKTLEEELVIARRKAKIQTNVLLEKQAHHNLPDIDKLLKCNDTVIKSHSDLAKIASESPNTAISDVLPLNLRVKPLQLRKLCPLSFTKSGQSSEEIRGFTGARSYRRTFQGFSDGSLLHFQAALNIIEAQTPRLQELTVSCSEWARPELAKCLQKFSFERNINKALYALSSFSELATRRAQVWATLHKRFPLSSVNISLESEDVDLEINGNLKPDRRDLVANLARRVMTFRAPYLEPDISSPNIEVSLVWNINIDATGEASSNISSTAKLSSNPEYLEETDTSRQFSKVLNILMAEYGILEGMSKLLETLYKRP